MNGSYLFTTFCSKRSFRPVRVYASAALVLLLAVLIPCGLTSAEKFTVLDSYSFWRIYNVFKPPVIQDGTRVQPLFLKQSWMDRETPPPAAAWTEPGFDDHKWLRGSIYMAGYTPYLARACFRGKFNVTDPARVRELRVSAGFQGGAVIYVNGQEVARANIKKAEDLAEAYPLEAFIAGNGALLVNETDRSLKPEDPKKLMRRRVLDGVLIPAKLLVKGVNVIECELVRAPYDKVVYEKKDPKTKFCNLAWNTCYLERLELTAESVEGLVPNTNRPEGLQVWNNNLLANDYDMDFGDPNEKLYPVEIAGTKNGSFSGKVVLGSTKPLAGVKVTVSELAGQAGVIPPAQVRIRYGYPWGQDYLYIPYSTYPFLSPYPAEANLLGCISDDVLEKVPVSNNKALKFTPVKPGPRAPGAVLPVFITIKVPKDAAPGTYSGAINIQVKGEAPVTVPLELKVAGWALPDPDNFRTFVEIIQSPDTLALEYNVPLWSEKHWELVAQSLKLIGDSGSRILYVPLIAETNYGHGETMVRWIKKGENKYEYDFSVMEKYLDLAVKNMGKPKMVIFFVWDVYMIQEGHDAVAANKSEQETLLKVMIQNKVVLGKGPVVTLLDTEKSRNIELPKYTEDGSRALWKPLAEELMARMKKRGLEKAAALGMMNDAWPTKPEVAFWSGLLPSVPWVVHAHFGGGPAAYDLTKIAYQTKVWALSMARDNKETSLMGWRSENPEILARFTRLGEFDKFPTSAWRSYPEMAITGDQRGVGRLGGEFWNVLKDSKGERRGRIYNRYPQSNWRNLDIYCSLLAPGPGGPAANHHYLNFLEGLQECEARIAIERVLSEEAKRAQLGKDLKERCEKALAERLQDLDLVYSQLNNHMGYDPSNPRQAGIASHNWFISSGWEDRTETLFMLAGEVEKKLGKK